jgi:hypothetical protein
MKINPPPNCEYCAGQTESYQPNFAYQCHFCGHIGKIVKQPTKQEIEEEVKRIKGLE